jgi:hypothetical protein
MKQATPTLPAPSSAFADSDWLDPLEEAVRGRVRSFIEQLLEEELEAALGRGRYERVADSNGRRRRPHPPELPARADPPGWRFQLPSVVIGCWAIVCDHQPLRCPKRMRPLAARFARPPPRPRVCCRKVRMALRSAL